MSRSSILKCFLVGTERSPLPESELVPFDLPPSPDPAETILAALAAANLAQKAGFPLPASSWSEIQAAKTDDRPVCSSEVQQDLSTILSGRYADALPEFLDLLTSKNLRLPPESLPELLDKAERDPSWADKIRPALGPRGEWLAQQHPRWRTLTEHTETDWFTAAFADRKQLLRQTRARNPLLALAWLEKTWPEEKAEHKVQFLDILHLRLSGMDESLLEKALLDKSREVRRTAAKNLMFLAESRFSGEARTFFQERFADGRASGFSRAGQEDWLKQRLPDISEAAIQPWLALLNKDALRDWRIALLRLFVGLLPPSDPPMLSGRTPEQWLEQLDSAGCGPALLESIAGHHDANWVETILRYFSNNFRHTIWQSKEMTAFLTLFAPVVMDFVQKSRIQLGYDNQVVLRALENFRLSWPRPMLEALLEQYGRAAYGNGEIPGWHYVAALQTAAYHCSPADATASAMVRDYLNNPPKAHPREFETFLAIVRFRLTMREHLQ